MSLIPPIAVPSEEETKHQPPFKTFYEVSFLNTISLLYLNQPNPTNLSKVQRIKDLVTEGSV